MQSSPRTGVSGLVTAILALGTLSIGLIVGLTVGGAGGYLLGQHRAAVGQPGAVPSRAAAVPGAGVAPGAGRPRAFVPQPATAPAPPAEGGGAEATPPDATPGLPRITVIGGNQAFLGVEAVTAAPATPGAGDEAAPGTTTRAGAEVTRVESGSAAEKAGVTVGDLIVAVGDTPVASAEDLAAAIGEHEPGDTVTLTIVRDGAERELDATLGTRTGVIPLDPSNPDLNDLLRQMPPELRDHFRDLLRPPSEDSGA